MPGLPSRTTYVLTFSSGKCETHGNGGVPRSRSPCTTNGVTPSHVLPSESSWRGSGAGTTRRSRSAGTRQCANSRSHHVWPWTHAPWGNGQGRCSTSSSVRRCSRLGLITRGRYPRGQRVRGGVEPAQLLPERPRVRRPQGGVVAVAVDVVPRAAAGDPDGALRHPVELGVVGDLGVLVHLERRRALGAHGAERVEHVRHL